MLYCYFMRRKNIDEKGFGVSYSEYRNIVMFLKQLPIPLYVERVAPGVVVKDEQGHKVWLKSKRELRAFKTILKNLFDCYKLGVPSESSNSIDMVNSSLV